MAQLRQLYPLPTRTLPLEGAYLAHDLRSRAEEVAGPYVYANFVTSVDGRIAVPREEEMGMKVPAATANERDWRLYQELAAQADLIISSGRYLREWAEGKGQEILQVDDPRFADLRAWRQERGLKPQADLAILSNSLRFPLPEVLTAGGREVVVFTSAAADPARRRDVEARAGQVVVAGVETVDGAELVKAMGELGYRVIYSAAGPKIMQTLVAGGVLNRLYLTVAHRLLGGRRYATMVEGAQFEPAVGLALKTVYLDPAGVEGLGQLFLSYDRV